MRGNKEWNSAGLANPAFLLSHSMEAHQCLSSPTCQAARVPQYPHLSSPPYFKVICAALLSQVQPFFPLGQSRTHRPLIVGAPAELILIAMVLGITSSMPWALYAAEAMLFGIVYVICYRRFFHPLAKVPSPFLPAVTRLYLWYHNVIKDGSYYKRIDEMHAKYGTRPHSEVAANPNPSHPRSRRPDRPK
jgi:hypothetical protein